MKAYFDHKKHETDNIVTFYFRPESGFSYTAGQYVELTLDHKDKDDRGNRRWFTLSSSPTEELLAITTRLARDNGSSFKHALIGLDEGQELGMNGPFGDFVLPMLVQTPLVFVAAGIGITPFRSIFKWLTDTGETRPIRFIYGVRNEEDIVFQDVLDSAEQRATIVISDPSDAWGGERGHISAGLIRGLADIGEDSLIYVSGPEKMVAGLGKELIASGINKRQVVTDEFPNYPDI